MPSSATANLTITATLLDEFGQPVTPSVALQATTQAASVLDSADTEICAIVRPTEDGGFTLADGRFAGPRNQRLGSILVGRSGFESWDTAPTVVGITASDPSGILAALPSSVTIPAGDDSAEFPIDFLDACGDATIALSYGSQTIDIPVRSGSDGWSCIFASLALPAGAETHIPLQFGLPHRAEVTVTGVSSNSSVARVLDSSATLHASELVTMPSITAVSPGTATLTFSCAGLPDIEIPITVREEEVSYSNGTFTLSSLAGSSACGMALIAPDGVTFSSATGPIGSSTYLTISGVGTSVLKLEFTDGETRPSTVGLEVTFSGEDANSPFHVEVVDGVHDQDLGYLVSVAP